MTRSTTEVGMAKVLDGRQAVSLTPENPTRCLAHIVASRPPWLRARLSTILVWPTLHGGWTAILSYAHYATVQPGETQPPDNNVAYPHDTHHPLALDGREAAAVQAQVRDLARTGVMGTPTLSRLVAPPPLCVRIVQPGEGGAHPSSPILRAQVMLAVTVDRMARVPFP